MALEACASSEVGKRGQLSIYPNVGRKLAYDKLHGTILASMGHEMGNAVNTKNLKRCLLSA
jgi:hypothetical protein